MGGIIGDMRKFIAFFMMFCALSGTASAYVEREVAVLRVMNKDAGKVHEVKVLVGDEVQFEKRFINVRSCKQSDPFDAENFWGFVEISEVDKGRIYSNWMNRNEPGQNPLQHADYDVWLVKCE